MSAIRRYNARIFLSTFLQIRLLLFIYLVFNKVVKIGICYRSKCKNSIGFQILFFKLFDLNYVITHKYKLAN